MKVYAHSIDGEVQAFYKTEEQAQKCIDTLNNVFNQRRRKHGIDFDLRVALLEVFDIGKEAPVLEVGPTTLQWEVHYIWLSDGHKSIDPHNTREEARAAASSIKNSGYWKDVRIERVEYREIKREVVR